MVVKIFAMLILSFFVFAAPAKKKVIKPTAKPAAKKVAPKPTKRVAPAPKPKPQPQVKKTAPKAPVKATPPPPEPILEVPVAAPVEPEAQKSVSRGEEEKISSQSRWAGIINYSWWQEVLDLKNPAGTAYTLRTNTHGPCFGFAYLQRYVSYEIEYDACGFFGTSDISATKSTPTYSQRNVPTYGGFLGAGFFVKPKNGRVRFGIEPSGMMRYADWTVPPGWTIETTRITGGGFVRADWRISNIFITQKTGYFIAAGWVWSLGFSIMW